MHKRLEKEFGEQVVEKRGWHWALTGWALEAYGASLADDPAIGGSGVIELPEEEV